MEPFVQAALLAIPLYAANGSPVIIRGRRPIDFGRLAPDGRRVFGDGKTWEGLAGGIAMGTMAGWAASLLEPAYMSFAMALLLSCGALLGDLLAAFVKRRAGMKRGDPAFPLDQLDFVIGGLALATLFGYNISLLAVISLLLVTPAIHVVANLLAYLLKLKSVPW